MGTSCFSRSAISLYRRGAPNGVAPPNGDDPNPLVGGGAPNGEGFVAREPKLLDAPPNDPAAEPKVGGPPLVGAAESPSADAWPKPPELWPKTPPDPIVAGRPKPLGATEPKLAGPGAGAPKAPAGGAEERPNTEGSI